MKKLLHYVAKSLLKVGGRSQQSNWQMTGGSDYAVDMVTLEGASIQHPLSIYSAYIGTSRRPAGNKAVIRHMVALFLCLFFIGVGNAWAAVHANAVDPVAGQSYYLYNVGTGKYVGYSVATYNASSISLGGKGTGDEAQKFTLTGTSLGSITLNAAEQYIDKTWGMKTSSSISTSGIVTVSIEAVPNKAKAYYIKMSNDTKKYLKMSSASMSHGVIDGTKSEWCFIPAATLEGTCSVTSKKADGTISIVEPTKDNKAIVTFNVSGTGTASSFNYTCSNSNIKMGAPTRASNVVTVPVYYKAINKHGMPVQTATITVSSKTNSTSVSGTAYAYVNLQPTFSTVVSELDWSHTGLDGEEVFSRGADVAASSLDRLSNKLAVTGASKVAQRTTTSGGNKTDWTATIIGTNASQFKFANGTQSVSGYYNNLASLLDVHYAPNEAGEHTATLHIVASYTDAYSQTLTDSHDIALSGICAAGSEITFAADGNQSPSNDESYNFGNIIGTNTVDVTADLFISQITSPQMEWSDPDGAFEFDESSVNLEQENQTLTFSAHRTTAAAANTEHTATLTISGTGTQSEPVSATLTLTYTALPRANRTVTWNWSTIRENVTKDNPFSTDFDGEWTWTLTKTAGDKIIYDEVAHTITAEYFHHEPAQAAAFILQIPQTDTYLAFEEEYETLIDVSRAPTIHLTTTEQYNTIVTLNPDGGGTAPAFTQATLDQPSNLRSGDNYEIVFTLSGQNAMSFNYHGENHLTLSGQTWKPYWTITEYYSLTDANDKSTIAELYTLPEGDTIWGISPHAVKFSLDNKSKSQENIFTNNTYGDFKDITFFDYDTIQPKYFPAPLIYDEDVINPTNLPVTFANKRQVTVTLNEKAAQYFTIGATGKSTGSSMVFGEGDGLGVGTVKVKTITIALKGGVTASQALAATAGDACQIIFEDDYTYDHEALALPIVVISPSEITYKAPANGSYTVTYQNDGVAHSVNNADYDKSINTLDPADYIVTLSAPTPAAGYVFQGWKIKNEIVSYRETFKTSITSIGSEEAVVVEAVFTQIEGAYFKVDDVFFDDLNEAINAAKITFSKVVTVAEDVTLGDGSTVINYTIPVGVTLLIPHKANFYELQKTPDLVNVNSPELELAQKLSAYRTLTLKEGVTITCDGTICVAGNMVTANGGRKSAYPTGEVGMINMVHGGHIELNEGANLYCWGYIKGQDMDQGNNTVGTGTVTANAGSVIWEDFELGDWRGGSASFDIYSYNQGEEPRQLFPFQSYAIQNIEVPTTFKYQSTLRTYTSITTGLGSFGAVFAMIGSGECMFKLQDANSVVRTWYDATTDLTCYELSGSAKLDQLNITVYVSMSSKDFILPISNSMHIILASDLDLVNPLMAQAGSIIEIKPTATVNLTSDLYLYDVDEWGPYIHNYCFRSFNNITSHKDRGAEDSKDGLDDAKLIVDGIFNVNTGGKIYATAGGANVMGNNGGVINFNAALPTAPKDLWYVTVINGAPYIEWGSKPVKAANLCNEDGSYTRSIGGTTQPSSFYNINGRWFHEEDKDELENHTYAFTYIEGGNMGEDDIVTAAVYSHDKTGLEARKKWFNVTPDYNCATDEQKEASTSDWWNGTNPTAKYNYTMLGEWHQFIKTENTDYDQYSCSNNVLYKKIDCNWTEDSYIDENCLYTFGDVKKALVDGEFIPLTANGYDPAYYHEKNEVKTYYICFIGCNWHPATPYSGESKAYTIEPETGVKLHYIWFNNDWLNVERDGAFFFTADEVTNVRTYYEYVNGDWVVATQYVSVTDDAETRNFYMIKEAFNVASIKKNATITLLRDLTNVSEVLSFSTQNTTCTLDLNGHVLSGNIENMITVDAPGCTFTITDNSTWMNGKVSNAANKAVYAKKGTVVLTNGTLEATDANAIACASAGAITINGGYLAAATQCVHVLGSCTINGGHFTDNTNLEDYCAANKYPFVTDDPKYGYEVSDAWVITFVGDEEVVLQTLHVKPGEMPKYTAAKPTKEGNKFIGWDPEIVAAIADATYTAQFEATSDGERCVTLNSNGGKESMQYIYVTTGSTVNPLPAGTTKDGYTFAGWFTDATNGTQITTETVVSADVTWYAHYTPISYTLTWDAKGGNISGDYTSGSVACGETITAPANANVTKEGHTFLGWNATPATTMPAHDVTYTAQWSVAAKHYLQNIDGTYPETPAATDDVTGGAGEYVTPAVKTYDGFITPATQTVKIGVEDEVRYEYVRRSYTITLDANGGTCATKSLTVKHEGTLTLPEATKNGAPCSGWFTKAIGGDQITDETEIMYNIGTLYAQYNDLNVTAPLTVSDERTVTDVRVTTTGSLNITGLITTNNFYLESNGSTASGQLTGAGTLIITGNAYFDLKINAINHKWYSIAVPWQVNPASGISVNGRTLEFTKDFDILYYDGATRATAGSGGWKYLEEKEGDKTMKPGTLYMIGLMMDAPTIRFTKAGGNLLTTSTSVSAYSSAVATNANWNGIANPSLFHAYLNDGSEYHLAQSYNPATDDYSEIDLSTTPLVVGQPVFVQAPEAKSIEAYTSNAEYASHAPRRVNATEKKARFTLELLRNEQIQGRLFVAAEEDKADQYIIGKDLVKMGVSSTKAQMWINRYNAKLCLNTQSLTDGVAEYPLTISAPQAGEYVISNQSSVSSDQYDLYLTYNGRVIWNLTYAPYTFSLPQGTTTGYGLRLNLHAPQVTTGIDEAVVNAQGETRKVLINDQVFIIRGNQVYSIDGQLVK